MCYVIRVCDGSIVQRPTPCGSTELAASHSLRRRRSRLQNRRGCLARRSSKSRRPRPLLPLLVSFDSFQQSVHDEVCGQGSFLPVHHHLGVVQPGTRLVGRQATDVVLFGRGRDQICMSHTRHNPAVGWVGALGRALGAGSKVNGARELNGRLIDRRDRLAKSVSIGIGFAKARRCLGRGGNAVGPSPAPNSVGRSFT